MANNVNYKIVNSDFWSILIPDDWVYFLSKIGSMNFESANKEKEIFMLTTEKFTDNKTLKEQAVCQQNIALNLLPQVENVYSWQIIQNEIIVSDKLATVLIDAIDKNRNYRIATKIIVNLNYVVRVTIHDYNCLDYEKSKKYFEPILGSLKHIESPIITPPRPQVTQPQKASQSSREDRKALAAMQQELKSLKLGRVFFIAAIAALVLHLITLGPDTFFFNFVYIIGVSCGVIGFWKIRSSIEISVMTILAFCLILFFPILNIIYFCFLIWKASKTLGEVSDNISDIQTHLNNQTKSSNSLQKNISSTNAQNQIQQPKIVHQDEVEAKPSIKTVLPYLKQTFSTDQWQYSPTKNDSLKLKVDGLNLSEDQQPVSQVLHGGFVVFYIIDNEEKLHYINQGELDEAGMTLEQLHETAMKNLDVWANNHHSPTPLQVFQSKDKTHFVISLDHNFDSTLMLLDSVWNHGDIKEAMPNGVVAAIPTRGALLFCDSESTVGIEQIKLAIAKIQAKQTHHITDQLFIRKNDLWSPYDPSTRWHEASILLN